MQIAPTKCRGNFSISVGEKIMGQIKKTIEVFERLRKPACRINVENGVEILLRFSREHYHHLAGFQHLTDLPDIASPANGRQKFYNDIRKGNIPEERICSSVKYPQIADRINYFETLEEILCPGEGRIIVEFDKSSPGSLINAKFYLFKHRSSMTRKRYILYAFYQ
jgi:hypothetical protein